MTKSEFIARLASSVPYLNAKEAANIVSTFFSSITEALVQGEKVELRGFGSFKVKERRARVGRNPKTGETVHVKEKRVPFFKPGKDLRDLD